MRPSASIVHRMTDSMLPLRSFLAAVLVTCFITVGPAVADDTQKPAAVADEEKPAEEKEDEEKDPEAVTVRYDNGLRLESGDGNFKARIRFRAQTRGSSLSSEDLAGEDDGLEEASGFRVQRARFKIDGHVYRPWLEYYLEYGIARGAMLTFQFDLQSTEKIGVRVGQYKVLYNRERVDSSGAQQFADRSIVNSPFTLDRQQGLTVMGRLFAGTLADSSYAGGVFTGSGRGGDLENDHRPMYIGRWQWNFLKRDLPFSQSDIRRRKEPAASLAFAGASSHGEFTRFSSSGGGQLPGFEGGDADRYKLKQWLAEFAYHGKGLSIQSEYHWKEIDDTVDNVVSDFSGWYAQAGYFLHEAFDSFPEPLEIAFRYARVDSGEGIVLPSDRELIIGGNWFFNGHNNKLTLDYSVLKSTLHLGSEDTGWRVRAQWDISF